MKFIIVLLCFIIEWIQADESAITKAMKHHEVIPDVIDEGPRDILKVTFDSGAMANMGEELTPTQVKNPPKIEWPADPNAFYTLLFTEPDAPTRKDTSLREWHHWLVVNIPGNRLENGIVLSGYQGSAPSKGLGYNRYVYLLFKQPKKLEFDEQPLDATSVEGRSNFSTRKFSEKYGLGAPVAGNFYQAQYDEYSDVLLTKLGF